MVPFLCIGQENELAVGREKHIGHYMDMAGSSMEIGPSPPSNPHGIQLRYVAHLQTQVEAARLCGGIPMEAANARLYRPAGFDTGLDEPPTRHSIATAHGGAM